LDSHPPFYLIGIGLGGVVQGAFIKTGVVLYLHFHYESDTTVFNRLDIKNGLFQKRYVRGLPGIFEGDIPDPLVAAQVKYSI
jgi:hypothetical protein